MVERQFCFEIKKVGENLDIEHEVFNLIYLIEIFHEFYPKEFTNKNKDEQQKVKNPKELLTLILWAKSNKRESCRDIVKWYDNNDETCQLVTKCQRPSKNTIIRFKNEYTDLIDKFDQFLIDFGMGLELIAGERLYADGTILKAWCNTFKKMYPYEIQYLKEFLEKNCENTELWAKLKKYYHSDERDDELKKELSPTLKEFEYNLNSNGIHLLKLSLRSSKDFNKVLERIKHMENNIDGENSVSIIDPEARHMIDKNGNMGLNYNYQTVTDHKYGFRIAHYVTNHPNDQKEAKKLADLTAQRLHTDDFTICFDNGYWDIENLKAIMQTNTQVVIPDSTDATRKKKKNKSKYQSGKRQEIVESQKKANKKSKNKPNRIKKHEFKYFGKEDAFQCPKTKECFKVTSIVTVSGVKKKKYTCEYCINCPHKKECTSQYRRIFYEIYDPDIEEIRRFYYSDEGQEIYSKRGHYAETSFAVLLESRNFRGLKTKGLKNTDKELTLSEIHHNVKKFEKLTTNKFLKLILNDIKSLKKRNIKIDFTLFDEYKGKYIIHNDVITGIRDHERK